jgi:chitin synthase
MSNILDKPTESVFGYITVLPGAFSAYRYIALKNDSEGKGPLSSYFKGEKLHGKEAGKFNALGNMLKGRCIYSQHVPSRRSNPLLGIGSQEEREMDPGVRQVGNRGNRCSRSVYLPNSS